MHDRSIAARVCLVAALSAVIGVPGLHAVLHEIEEHEHEHQHEHADHDHGHGHGHHARHDDHEDDGEHHHHHHQHGHGGGPLHGQDAPEHLQIALTEAPPPAIIPVAEIVRADEPLQLADRLIAPELAPTRSSRGPPLTRV